MSVSLLFQGSSSCTAHRYEIIVDLWKICDLGSSVTCCNSYNLLVAMAAASPPERHPPLLQLQEVDSSRVGGRVLSPILTTTSSSPVVPLETSQPICIPSPYTELGHDFTTLPFYGPSIFSYAGPSISDCPSVHQSISASLFWPSHGHVGPTIPLHHSQSRPQHGQPIQSPWDSVFTR